MKPKAALIFIILFGGTKVLFIKYVFLNFIVDTIRDVTRSSLLPSPLRQTPFYGPNHTLSVSMDYAYMFFGCSLHLLSSCLLPPTLTHTPPF